MDLHTHRSLYVLLEQSEMGRPPGRPPDQFFWDRVDIIPGWKCKLCKQVISYDAYTINVHLAKVEDEGIKICKGEVDRETLHAAKEAVRDLKGKGAKRGRSMETGTTSARPHPLVADSRNTLRSLDQSNPISVSPQGAKHSIRSLEANSLHSEGCVPDADQLFWDRGDIIEQWKWECKFCKKDFSGGVSRIKAHLAKVKSLGIQICEGEVDIETLDAAKEAVRDLKRGVKRKWSKETGTTSADPSADEAPQQGNTSGRSHPLVADSGNTLRSLDQSNPISVSPQGALDTIPPRHPELRDQDSISNQHINSAPTIHQVATDLQTLNLANHHTRLQGDNDTNQTSFPVDMTQAYIVTGLTAGTSNLQGFTRIDTNISDGRVNAKTRELHEALLDVPVIRSSEPDGLLERTQMGRSANCRPNAGAVPVGAVTLQNTQHSTDPQAPIQLGRPTFSETQTSATSHDSSYKKYITFEAYSLHSEGCVPDAAATAPEIQSAHSCGTQIVRSTDFLRDADLAPVNQQDIQHSTAGIDPSVETSGYGHAGNARAGDIPRNNIVPEQPNHLEPMHIDTEAINPSTRAIPSLQLNVRDDVHGASNSINVSPVEAADTIHLTNPPRHPESRDPDRISNQPISSGFQPPSIQPCAETGLAAGFEQMDIDNIGAAVGTSNAGGITNADWRNTACSSFDTAEADRSGWNHNPQDPLSISQNSCSSMIQELQNNRIVELGRVNSEGRVTDAGPTSSEIQHRLRIDTEANSSSIWTNFHSLGESTFRFLQDQPSSNGPLVWNANRAPMGRDPGNPHGISNYSESNHNTLPSHGQSNPINVSPQVATTTSNGQGFTNDLSLRIDSNISNHRVNSMMREEARPNALSHAGLNVPPTNTGDIHENMMLEHNEPMQVERDSGNAWERSQPSSSSSSVAMESRGREIFELAPHIVGRDQYVDDICNSLKDKIPCIGVYGPGGVGKTTIMKRLHDKVRGDPDFGELLWVTVSQDCSLLELQNKLSMSLEVADAFRNVDKVMRPTFLNKHLRQRGKTLVILDDLWLHYELEELGIKLMKDGDIQLVLTTRHHDVCQRMMCEKEFAVKCLPDVDAMNLFEKTLGYEMSDSRKGIAKDIIGKCRGLPLAIVVIAAHMRGVDSDHGWHSTLERLRNPEEVEAQHFMGKEVFPILRHSYNKLNGRQQQCFLLCALYPEDWKIPRHELIELYIDEGVIHKDSRWEMCNEANHILDELEKKCLLEKVVDDGPLETDEQGEVRMHDVIRDLALHIMNSKGTCIVKCHIPLDEIPVKDDGSGDLQKVSLVRNSFMKELPSLPSNCPKLSTLLVSGCYKLSEIPECYFERAKGLKVVDISCTAIARVPRSITKLESLNALILRECRKLRSVPSLETLKSLRKLDLGYCELIDAVPDGVEKLVNLTYLDLSRTRIKEIKAGVVGKLQKLQYLGLGCVAVHGKEVATLEKLEIMSCRFKEMNELSDYMQHRQHESTLKAYTLLIGDYNNTDWKYCIMTVTDGDMKLRWDMKVVILERGNSAGETLHIPSDVTALRINCDGEISCTSTNFNQLENLETLSIRDCREQLRAVLYRSRLTKLKRLQIDACKELESITGLTEEPQVQLPEGKFTQLQSIRISMCPKMRHVVGPELLPRLRNLPSIYIWGCDNMEEVIAMPSEPPPLANTPILPLLTTITIMVCPKMRHVVGPELLPHLPKLHSIDIWGCENMEEVIYGPPPLANTPILPLLTTISIGLCPKMKRLLTLELFTHLPNLNSIHVSNCKRMKEVIGTESEHGIGPISNKDACMLPPPSLSSRKPLSIHLDALPELESISNWPHIRSFIRRIHIEHCPKLKRIPFLDGPFLDGCPSAPPFFEKLINSYYQWESMEWEHPQAKDSLEPYVFIFSEYDELPIDEWRCLHLPFSDEESDSS